MMTLSENLAWRGFVNQTTYKDITALDHEPITFYLGIDPSADSMTVGNLAVVMMVRHFVEAGHKAVLLVGGATGMIGDPDGKKQERDLLTLEQIDKNKQAIAAQYRQILAGQPFEPVDNYDWFKTMGYLEFLRDVGKHVPMRQMLGRDFVQSRLGEDGAGISYAEFSYALIQGYDFLHLYKEYGVSLQICGADQWGNSIAGVDLIRRLTGGEAHVWSAPLVVNKATGQKFGKSEAGAVWLDENKTSAYTFYQFWLNVDDDSAIDFLKLYTMLSKEQIEDVVRQFNDNRSSRLAQKTVAYEVTKLVHGSDKADSIVRVTDVLFGNRPYIELTAEDAEALKRELPHAEVKTGDGLIDALVATQLAASASEARRFLEQGSIYLNGAPVDLRRTISPEDRLNGSFAIIRRGKNSNAVLQISE
jgi:tyrosyl-tRNA synthetase